MPNKTKRVDLSTIDHNILSDAIHRANYRDDPCAEYSIGGGWLIVAEDVVAARLNKSDTILAYQDPDLK